MIFQARFHRLPPCKFINGMTPKYVNRGGLFSGIIFMANFRSAYVQYPSACDIEYETFEIFLHIPVRPVIASIVADVVFL